MQRELILSVETSFKEPLFKKITLGSVIIGRSSSADIVIRDVAVSRRHARLYLKDGNIFVEDLNSTSGVWMDGKRLQVPALIQPGMSFSLALGKRNTDYRITLAETDADGIAGAIASHLEQTICVSALELRHAGIDSQMDSESAANYADRLKQLLLFHDDLADVDGENGLYDLLLERLTTLLKPRQTIIYLCQKDGSFSPKVGTGNVDETLFSSKTVLHEVIKKGNALLVSDIRHDRKFSRVDSVADADVSSLIAAPLFRRDEIHGMIVLITGENQQHFNESDLRLMVCLSSAGTLRLDNLILMQEKARYLEERNYELERLVTLRSEELQRRNEELERKNREIALAQDQMVVKEKMAVLGQLTAGVAHEINNPLNYIEGGTAVLIKWSERFREFLFDLMDEGTGAEIRNFFEKEFSNLNTQLSAIAEGRSRISRIVGGLNLVTRKNEAVEKTADLRESLQAAVLLMQPNFTDQVTLTVTCEEPMPVECRPAELSLVFINLIDNGCNAVVAKREASGQSEPGSMEITGRLRDNEIVLSFCDHGMGMPESFMNKIFEPFFTTRPPGMGTGLGLYTCYNIMKRHGGRITVESIEGEGSTFTLYLPFCEDC
ncbi:MAG: ATP-binding protein [Acidobacteriota bacterium]|nr:ATP-binding protein [Acidobacteriota bacterium]